MRCEHCGGDLVEVDNPMRREFRHRDGAVCPGRRPEEASDATSGFKENAKDLNTGDPVQVDVNGLDVEADIKDRFRGDLSSTPPDVEAIRARHREAENIEVPGPRVWAEIYADHGRLLDENARLNAELAEWRRVGGQANQGLKDAAAELEARNDEITRMGKEIVKANEGFAAIWTELDAWDLTDEQIDRMTSNIDPVQRVTSWLKLTTGRACAQTLKAILDPAPEMPRPPAEEAALEYRCPNCYRWAPWTDGVVDGDDEGVEEFWCQTCGSQTPVENMDSRPQERAGDAGTSGTGRDTQVRQNGAETPENEEPSYGS